MAQTALSICNAALGRLGQDPVVALSDGTKVSDNCGLNWPIVRDAVLRGYDWPCASVRTVLTPYTTIPAWGWDQRFALPTDYLCLREISETEENYQVENGYILANVATLSIRYTARLDDPDDYDSVLLNAMVAAMVDILAYGVTGSTSLAQLTEAKASKAIQEGKGVATQEKDRLTTDDDYSWLVQRG